MTDEGVKVDIVPRGGVDRQRAALSLRSVQREGRGSMDTDTRWCRGRRRGIVKIDH